MITILGAGLSGLSVAYYYPKKSIIFEKLEKIGGTASTQNDHGVLYDYGPHVSFTKDHYLINLLLKYTSIFEKTANHMNAFKGNEFPHPALFHLNKLPKDERYKILIDYIEAYKNFYPLYKPINYDEWCVRSQGKYFAHNYTDLYTRKFWQIDPKNLTTEWVGERLPIPSIHEALKGSFGLNEVYGYYFEKFRYPKNGGFESFSNFWLDRKKDITINLKKEVISINTKNKTIRFKDGTYTHYNILVSTIPIPELPNIISNMPSKIKNMISKLRYTSLHYVNIAIKEKWKRNFTWLYFYDEEIPISRLIPYTKMSPYMAPKGYTPLQIEIPYSKRFQKDLVEVSLSKLQELGYIKSSNIARISESDLKYGYVIYNKDREKYLEEILNYLKELGIYSIGRYGSWAYLWSHQVIAQGKEFSDTIIKHLKLNLNGGDGN
ncbi:MAG: NAD(P)-binding protein [Candidatus Micrarchaeaceae archaeon]